MGVYLQCAKNIGDNCRDCPARLMFGIFPDNDRIGRNAAGAEYQGECPAVGALDPGEYRSTLSRNGIRED